MNPEVNEIVSEIIGEPCTRKEVGAMRSLSLGFGDESTEPRSRKRKYRKWEVGTYGSDWKIVDGAEVVLAKNQSNNIGDLDTRLDAIFLGRLAAIQQMSKSTIRVIFDNELTVEVSGDMEEDEYFHVFCPNNKYVEFSEQGWRTGRSDVPWSV